MSSDYELTANFTAVGADDVKTAVESNIEAIQEYYATIKAGQTPTEDQISAFKDARGEIIQQQRAYNSLKIAYSQQMEGAMRYTQTLSTMGNVFRSVNSIYQQYNMIQVQNQQIALRVQQAESSLTQARMDASQQIQQANYAVQQSEWRVQHAMQQGGMAEIQAQQQLAQAKLQLANTTERSNYAIQQSENALKQAQLDQQRARQQEIFQYISMGLQLGTTLPSSIMQSVVAIRTLRASRIADVAATEAETGATGESTIATIAHTAATGATTVATGAWTAAQWLLNIALDANPIGIVILAVMGLITVIGIVTKGFRDWTPVVNAVNFALQGLEKAGRAVFGFFQSVFGVQIKLWIAQMQLLWDIIKPIVQGLQAVAGGIASLGNIGKIHLPKLASGGIVTSPTVAEVGEAGPEAIIPLNNSGIGGLGQTNISVNITIQQATLTDNRSIATLAQQIANYVGQQALRKSNLNRVTI